MFSNSNTPGTLDAPRYDRRAPAPTTLLDPVYIIRSVWASKWLIAFTTLVGILVAVAVALSTPKEYTATTEILADPRDIKVVANEVTPNGLPSDATLALIESQMAVIYSNDVLGRVVDDADLVSDPEFNGTAESTFGSVTAWFNGLFGNAEAINTRRRLQTLANFRQATTVTRDPKSFVLNLSVETWDPDKSAQLVNRVAETFIDQLGRVQSSTARRASDALSSRLAELRRSVVEAERAVEEYKSANGLVGVGGRLVDDDYILRMNDQLARSRSDITALRVRAEQMANASVDAVVEGSFPEELTSEALSRLRNTYSELAQQTASLAVTLGPRHPQLLASEQALDSARSAISQEVSRIVAAAQTELSRAEQTNRDLNEQIDELKTKQVATSGSFVKLRELEREVEASRAVYEAFLLRARETGEQEMLNTANVRVISSATPPLEPSSVSRRAVVMVGAVLGLLAGIGLAVLWAIITIVRSMPATRPAAPAAPIPTTLRLPDATSDFRPTVLAAASDMRRERPANDGEEPAESGTGRLADTSEDDAEQGTVPSASEMALVPEVPVAEAAPEDDEHRQPAYDVPPTERRRTLRERIQALAEEHPAPANPSLALIEEDAEVERLQEDIAAVKRHIAEIRSRRQAI
ncbi:chain-length determining protein [Aurantimonas aggregata]|uniref:Chain-length determining protein n=1 Tax=Aurantimonas aggregata TaxID=2047720 RepID=A0A6L9ME55_9HYPH|nr:GumC family protein [Aurantimonas aggregata]NDV86143.1 chain-length determining protein [Aurantimonas aggregata]